MTKKEKGEMVRLIMATLNDAEIEAIFLFWKKFIDRDTKNLIKADLLPIVYEHRKYTITDRQFVIGFLEVANKWLPFILAQIRKK